MSRIRAVPSPRTVGLLAAAAAAGSLAFAAPAQAAGVKATGTVKPIARSCAASRVARFKVELRHLRVGKEYIVQWSAPSRTGGVEQTQIPIIATAGRYPQTTAKPQPTVKSQAATPLVRRQFQTTIEVLAVKPTKANPDRTVTQLTARATVPACTPRR